METNQLVLKLFNSVTYIFVNCPMYVCLVAIFYHWFNDILYYYRYIILDVVSAKMSAAVRIFAFYFQNL